MFLHIQDALLEYEFISSTFASFLKIYAYSSIIILSLIDCYQYILQI